MRLIDGCSIPNWIERVHLLPRYAVQTWYYAGRWLHPGGQPHVLLHMCIRGGGVDHVERHDTKKVTHAVQFPPTLAITVYLDNTRLSFLYLSESLRTLAVIYLSMPACYLRFVHSCLLPTLSVHLVTVRGRGWGKRRYSTLLTSLTLAISHRITFLPLFSHSSFLPISIPTSATHGIGCPLSLAGHGYDIQRDTLIDVVVTRLKFERKPLRTCRKGINILRRNFTCASIWSPSHHTFLVVLWVRRVLYHTAKVYQRVFFHIFKPL
mmetsp:Transcript_8133/g.21527  ORF Transcript_8133/g.21527 Transcript_8133/m.21527 type:complete len:265 (-) Transcript_8133:177-971(-)